MTARINPNNKVKTVGVSLSPQILEAIDNEGITNRSAYATELIRKDIAQRQEDRRRSASERSPENARLDELEKIWFEKFAKRK